MSTSAGVRVEPRDALRRAALLLPCALLHCPALFADYPRFSGELVSELQSEATVASDDPEHEVSLTEINLELDLELAFSPWFALEGTALLEPVREPQPGSDSWFEQEGIFSRNFSSNTSAAPSRR